MVERAFDWGYGSSLSTRYSHSLRLLASFVEPRIRKRYSLGASLAPPRSPTRSLIGPQQRESPPIAPLCHRGGRRLRLELSQHLSKKCPICSGFPEAKKDILASASSPTWAPDPSFQLDAHDPGRVTRTRQAALPSPGNTTPGSQTTAGNLIALWEM